MGDRVLRGTLEALLFVTDEPLPTARVAKLLEVPEADVIWTFDEISQEYARDERGFQLREVAGGWRLYTHPAFHPVIERMVLSWDARRLSQAALEALAVVAYHQPVTRSGVNAVRGVNSEAVISSLVEKGLVREVGRDKAQGNAVIYGTTRTFLEKFGLKDISELPPLEEFAPDAKTEAAIRERLNAGEEAEPEASGIDTFAAADDEADDDDEGIATVD